MSERVESSLLERFLRYIRIDTQSSETSGSHPSTEKQKDLGRLLTSELLAMGMQEVYFDETYNYVYGMIPATDGGVCKEVLGFIAHMDTSPETSGKDVDPRIVSPYDGKDIVLNEADNIVLSPVQFPELSDYIGQSLIVTDGRTLLGADDKAGVAEIMEMTQILMEDAHQTQPAYVHGRIAVGFTTDEEIGEGVDFFDVKRFGADYAYTVDGGGIGELEFENFNAAGAKITVKGLVVHPGEAKNKMVNALRVAAAFDNALPEQMRPEYTSGYEGFYHLMHLEGDVESAAMSYIIRDHDRVLFEEKKNLMYQIAELLNTRYGEGTVTVDITDQYYNMREKIEPEYMFLVDQAASAMRELGIEPKIQPIRGGTDGARLSFMGLPCPNICTGGHNYHGRYEYCCIESMEKIKALLLKLACSDHAVKKES